MLKIFFILVWSTLVFAEPKDIPQIVIDAIKDVECLKISGVEENFFIRINSKKDVNVAKEHGYIFYKSHIIHCKDLKKCSKTTKELLNLGIENLDLGPFQINYYYQNNRWNDSTDFSNYFSISSAEQRAREILWDLIEKYGYSWRTIGRYHHYDPKNKKINRQYYSRLYKYIYGVTIPKVLLP